MADPVAALAVRQRAGGRDGRRRGAEGEGPRGRSGDRPGRRRRHGGHRLRLPVGDVRAQRRRALHLLRQRGLHEHRRAALRRDAAGRAHRHDPGRRPGARQRVRPGQERAADRDGARDPVRGHRDRRRAARPRGEGGARDGAARRALPARLRSLPARLGQCIQGHDQARPAREGDRHLPGLRGRGRCRHRRLADPPPGSRSRSTCGRSGASRTCSATPAARTSSSGSSTRADRNIARFGLVAEEGRPDGQAVRDHARRRLVARQQDRLVARRAPALHPSPAAVQQRLSRRRGHPEVALPRRGRRLRGRVAHARHRQPAARRDGPRLLPPVRDRLQPRRARRGRRHQRGRALPRRRGDPPRLAPGA